MISLYCIVGDCILETPISFDVVNFENNLHPNHECYKMSTCQMKKRLILDETVNVKENVCWPGILQK